MQKSYLPLCIPGLILIFIIFSCTFYNPFGIDDFVPAERYIESRPDITPIPTTTVMPIITPDPTIKGNNSSPTPTLTPMLTPSPTANATTSTTTPTPTSPQPISVSSVRSSNTIAGYAFDNDPTTYWAPADRTDDEWLIVDLNKHYVINNIILNWYEAASSHYKISICYDDSFQWRDMIIKKSGNDKLAEHSMSAIARYIRIMSTKRLKDTALWLNEIEIQYSSNNYQTPIPYVTNDWQTDTFYSPGDTVYYNTLTWECTYYHVSSKDWYPGATGIWFWIQVTND